MTFWSMNESFGGWPGRDRCFTRSSGSRMCLHHPFVRGLADGTLEPEAFRRYVAQDAYFLNAFARAYALAAGEETLVSLCELLNGVLRELQLHAGYAKELKIEL